MQDLSLSNKTVRGLHAMLRQCLEQAVKERLIPYNPATGCRLPPKEKKEMQVIPPEKIGDYLRAAEEHGVLPMFYLELTTGLRRGELVALLWSDLNVKEQTLSISKSAGRINGEVKVSQPKTANSVRTIYLPKETVDLLVEEHRKHIFNKYMFPSPVTGGMYGPDCVGRLHKTLLKKAGITEKVRFHDLRHTRDISNSERRRRKNGLQHPGTLLSGVYAGYLHPCDRRYAERGGEAGWKSYRPSGIKHKGYTDKNEEALDKIDASSKISRLGQVWVKEKLSREKARKKLQKSAEIIRFQRIFGPSGGI